MLHTIPTSRRPQPFYSQPVPPAENETLQGKARLGLAMLGLLAAGIDVRTRDLGLGGPASNPLEVLLLVVFLVLLADTVMLPRQPWAWARAAWSGNRWLVMYFLWAMFAAFVGLMKLAHSFFVFRNLLPAFFVFVLLMHSMRSVRDVRIVLLVFLVAAVPESGAGPDTEGCGWAVSDQTEHGHHHQNGHRRFIGVIRGIRAFQSSQRLVNLPAASDPRRIWLAVRAGSPRCMATLLCTRCLSQRGCIDLLHARKGRVGMGPVWNFDVVASAGIAGVAWRLVATTDHIDNADYCHHIGQSASGWVIQNNGHPRPALENNILCRTG